jgi:hypothetical protein
VDLDLAVVRFPVEEQLNSGIIRDVFVWPQWHRKQWVHRAIR